LEGWVGQLPISAQQELLKKDRATKAMGGNAMQVLLFDVNNSSTSSKSPKKSCKTER